MADLRSRAVDYVPNDAARLCDCSVDTIRRHRSDGKFPHAYRDGSEPNAPWRIPLADLVAAGLFDPAEPRHAPPSAVGDAAAAPGVPPAIDHVDEILHAAQDQIAWLREQNQQLLGLLDRLTSPLPAPAEAPLRAVNERNAA